MVRVTTIIAALARIVLGGLWVNEGVIKYNAGFGKADILLVTESTAQNPRVPDFYRLITTHVLNRVPSLFGFGVPLLELCLGIALVFGILTLPVALASVVVLCNYWLADQLITQYPIMLALSAAVASFAPSAARVSVTTLVLRRRSRPGASTTGRWL